MAFRYPDDYRVSSEYLYRNSCGTEVPLLVDTSSKKQGPGFKELQPTAYSSRLHERKRKQSNEISTQPPLDLPCSSTYTYCLPPPPKTIKLPPPCPPNATKYKYENDKKTRTPVSKIKQLSVSFQSSKFKRQIKQKAKKILCSSEKHPKVTGGDEDYKSILEKVYQSRIDWKGYKIPLLSKCSTKQETKIEAQECNIEAPMSDTNSQIRHSLHSKTEPKQQLSPKALDISQSQQATTKQSLRSKRISPTYCIVSLDDVSTFETGVGTIKKQIDKILVELKEKNKMDVCLFSIGKTYARKARKAPFLDPNNVKTFKKKGIRDRWAVHRQTEYGKDGMIIVAIITDSVAQNLGHPSAEVCALSIEKELQRQFSEDIRCIHKKGYHKGDQVSKPAEGFPIYMTYAFKDNDDHQQQ